MIDEIETLQALGVRENFERWERHVHKGLLSDMAAKLITDLGMWYKQNSSERVCDWQAFLAWFKHERHPALSAPERQLAEAIIHKLQGHTPGPVGEQLVKTWIKAEYMEQVAQEVMRYKQGAMNKDVDEALEKIVEGYRNAMGRATTQAQSSFLSLVPQTFTQASTTAGWNWRLDALNMSLGPARPGDFILVGSRPEAGKTSFAMAEMTHLAEQAKGEKVLVVNNEEMSWRILVRGLSCILGKSSKEILQDVPKALKAAEKKGWTADRLRTWDAHATTLAGIERMLESERPKFIVFNRLDKLPVRGGKDMNDAQRAAAQGFWARQLAAGMGAVVLGLVQADASAAGEKWVYDHQLYGSKTALQGEADAIVTIGAEAIYADERYIHIPKNKLVGGPNSIESKRHGFWDVLLNHETGIYKMPKGASHAGPPT